MKNTTKGKEIRKKGRGEEQKEIKIKVKSYKEEEKYIRKKGQGK